MTRSLVSRSLLIVAALALAPAARAQAPATPAGLATPGAATSVASAVARLEGIPDPRVRRFVADVLADADRRGLPLEPLVAKALEGVEKEAPPARIEAAVKGMVQRLAVARDALKPAVSDREVTAGADALAMGVPAEVLRAFREMSRRRSTAVALGVLSQLVSRGVPVAEATRGVGKLVERRASDAQLLALGQEVQRDLSQGIAAVTALEMRTRALVAALPAPLAPMPATLQGPGAEGANTPGRGGKP
ncbi:hypothetical protein [Roseisolibacter agri]|uniref:hypothetical protein n=1 Tax=Roseisolibacter agri TaxID=2014610 RepID=UPI0024E0CBB4|nr:hypothetical protein [Roseisolibacter agri]